MALKVFVGLLRAVNVGGTGKLLMTELRALCEAAGFEQARTYIQSGNVLFKSSLAEPKVKATLEQALSAKLGKPSAVLVRSRSELESIIERSPFEGAPPAKVLVVFMHEKPAKAALNGVVIPGKEAVELCGREVFVHYPDGMGRSKLKLPFAKAGTGRNLNTVMKLAALARALEEE
jgi:uncharacterized protein (DUF1697 family)